jgi:phosphatidylglycerophosphatase A
VTALAGAIATLGGIGRLPYAPGTWASAVALLPAWAIQSQFGPFGLLLATVAVFALGCWASAAYIRATGREDPSEAVIDEVAGQWLVLVPAPTELLPYLLGFAAFRALDILKPWPASWADRTVHGGIGVMLDDLLAALYGCVAMAAWMAWR